MAKLWKRFSIHEDKKQGLPKCLTVVALARLFFIEDASVSVSLFAVVMVTLVIPTRSTMGAMVSVAKEKGQRSKDKVEGRKLK